MARLLRRVFGRTSAILNVQNLSTELATVINWYILGLNLGLPKHELDKIECDHQGNDRRRAEMLDLWLRRTPNATWDDVIRALEQMGENRVAENIRQIHGEAPLTKVFSAQSEMADLCRALVLELECHTVKAKQTGRELGSGTYGRVIELKSGSKILAGKVFNIPSCLQPQTVISKLRKEVAVMAKIHHPNIVHFEGVCFLENHTMPVLLMERLTSNLHAYLLKPTNLTITLVVKLSILRDVASGLVYLHSRRPAIIHRDLTGNNILLDLELRAKIADFGNAQIMDLNPEATPKIFTPLPGTLDYMPPEADSSSAKYDPSLDVFSFGHLTLFTVIQSPVHPLLPPNYIDVEGCLHARSEVMRRMKYLERAKKLLGEEHPLVELIKECLHYQPAQRPKTVELEARLQDIPNTRANVDPPVVTQHPVSQLISTGAEAATFKIEATGDALTFHWQKNSSDLHSDSKYSGTDTNTLKIQHVKKSDAGHYRCLVKNPVEKGGKPSKKGELTVFDPPVVTQHPVSQLISTGAEAAMLKIEATGDALIFQWQINGSDLHSDSNYRGTDTNTLKIRHVKKSDAGHYRCLVKNPVEKDGKPSKKGELTVFDPPVVTQHPVSQLISTGAEAATFKIEATGDALTFQWQINGSDLHSDSNYSGTDTNTLKIRHVKKSDAGHYRCLVKNPVEKDGKPSKEGELTVFDFRRTTREPVRQCGACIAWVCCFCCLPCRYRNLRHLQGFPPSPPFESSEGNQFSLPLGSVDTLDLVPKMSGGVELQSLDEKPPEFTPSGAIRVQEFLDHVEKFDASRQLLFQKEHDWITNNSPWYSSDASNDPFNDDKNRYSNITAFDHSRVMLTPLEGVECSDYINANYVSGYQHVREYIAAQGPLDQTVDDFWRMVWEQNSDTIVMLTNLVELGKAKCSQYWPSDTSSSIHGSIKVQLKHSVVLPDYTIRNLTVELLRTGESRTVLQFHYTKWPDYGTPKLAAPLLNFLKAIRKSNPENTGAIVFHCSAGVGRSGTVMAIDYCLQQIKAEGIVNVRGFVSKMREQRNYMVQTEQQYTFIHYALLEAIAYGDTSFSLSDFPTSYEQLKEVNKETGRPLLEEEFDRLTTVRTMVLKSSFIQRVKLKGDCRRKSSGVSDFRAHYVDSYLEPQLMVVCDGPTEDSTAKFWQMVWDEGCTYLVMLTPQDGDYHCYWPNFGSLRQYGNLIVEVEEESAEHVYTTRKLILTDAKMDGVTHRVQQYQFIGWTTQFFPSVPSFVDLLCDVLKKTDSLQRKQRLLVHDTKSLGPSGIFCSLYYCVERLRLERVVDVFRAVQKMHLQRPGMMESVQQYAFIYDCMFEFIRTHSDSQ